MTEGLILIGLQLLAALGLYFFINWIGRHAVDFGYYSTSLFEDDEDSLALNLFVKAVLPAVYIVMLSAAVVAVGKPDLRLSIVNIIYFYFSLRLIAVIVLDRTFLMNWPKFVAHAIIGILLANLAYKHLILPNRSLLPNLESAGNEVWLAIFAFFYAIMNKVPLPEGPTAKRKNRFVRRKYSEVRSKHGELIDELLGSNDALKLLSYSILIMEDYVRPKTIRWLERKIPWKEQMSTGIMQVTAKERLSDEESIRIGIERLKDVWLSTADKDLGGWQRMVEVILSHNRDEDYLEKVLEIAAVIAVRVDTQFEKAMDELNGY